MSIVITEILGTDSISSSRPVINANFTNIKTAVDSLQDALATGSQVLTLKNGVNPTIVLTGTTGEIEANTITLAGSTSLTAAGSISCVGLTVAAATNLTGTLIVVNNATFQADTRMSGIVRKDGGIGLTPVDAATPTINVTNKYLLNIDYSAIPAGPTSTLLTLPNGVNGQELLVRCTAISDAGNTDGLAIGNILGAGSTGIRFTAAHQCVSLYYEGTKWLLVSRNGATVL